MSGGMEVVIKKLRVSPWRSYGLDENAGGKGLLKQIELLTNLGTRSHTLALSYEQIRDTWIEVFLIKTNYDVFAEMSSGFVAMELKAKGQRIAGVALKAEQSASGAMFTADNPKDVAELMAAFITPYDLDAIVFNGAGSIATAFPIPSDPTFTTIFRQVSDAVGR
jgi:hypothetical protein